MSADIESQTAFGRRIGVNQSRVAQLVAQGLPQGPGGKGIPIREGLAWIEENLDPERRERARRGMGKMAADGKRQPTHDELRRLFLSEKVQMARLRYEEAKCTLVDRGEARAAIRDRAIFVRDAFLGWVGPAARELAAETGADQRRLHVVLDRLVREQLAAIADTRAQGMLSDD